MNAPADPLIFLVGFMGSGKTTVGRALSRSLGWSFLDIDALIVAREGRSIRDIFRLYGEPYFRNVEREILLGLEGRKPSIVALGGGTFCQPENESFVRSHGVSIWLQCSLEEILRRLPNDGSRPLFRSPAEAEALFLHRTPVYERSDLRVPVTDRRVDEIVGDILEWLKTRWPVTIRLA